MLLAAICAASAKLVLYLRQLTKRLVEAGRILCVDVLDHIVLGDDSFSSLKELGMM